MLDFDALNAYLDNDEVIFAVLSVYQDHGNSLEEIQELVQQRDWGKPFYSAYIERQLRRRNDPGSLRKSWAKYA